MEKPITVPLLDLLPQYTPLQQEIEDAALRVLRSQQYINGPDVAALEDELAVYCKAKYCIGVSSGTDAILAALMALDIGPGDEVVTTPYSFFATAGCVDRLRAKCVFVDIDPNTFNIDPNRIEAALTPRTKAIMPVHLYGQCAEMDPIVALSQKHNIPVIEDAAQAIGSEYQGRRAGTMGAFGCFSFFPSKNLGAPGDAGAITTNDERLAKLAKLIRTHGMEPKYYHKMVGANFRIDSLHAAVLRVKLKHLDSWTAGRQANADFYTKAINSNATLRSVITPPLAVQSRHIYNQYVIRTHDRDGLKDFMKAHNIGTEIYYPVPLHLQECFKHLGYKTGDFPHSEAAAAQTLALPIYPELSIAQKQHVIDTLTAFATR